MGSTENLGPVMRACGSMPTNAEVEVARQEIDPDGSGSFGLPQLQALLDRRMITIEPAEVSAAFKVFDEAGSGSVSLGALKEVLTQMGEKLSDEEFNKFASVADPNASGNVDYAAFVNNA